MSAAVQYDRHAEDINDALTSRSANVRFKPMLSIQQHLNKENDYSVSAWSESSFGLNFDRVAFAVPSDAIFLDAEPDGSAQCVTMDYGDHDNVELAQRTRFFRTAKYTFVECVPRELGIGFGPGVYPVFGVVLSFRLPTNPITSSGTQLSTELAYDDSLAFAEIRGEKLKNAQPYSWLALAGNRISMRIEDIPGSITHVFPSEAQQSSPGAVELITASDGTNDRYQLFVQWAGHLSQLVEQVGVWWPLALGAVMNSALALIFAGIPGRTRYIFLILGAVGPIVPICVAILTEPQLVRYSLDGLLLVSYAGLFWLGRTVLKRLSPSN